MVVSSSSCSTRSTTSSPTGNSMEVNNNAAAGAVTERTVEGKRHKSTHHRQHQQQQPLVISISSPPAMHWDSLEIRRQSQIMLENGTGNVAEIAGHRNSAGGKSKRRRWLRVAAMLLLLAVLTASLALSGWLWLRTAQLEQQQRVSKEAQFRAALALELQLNEAESRLKQQLLASRDELQAQIDGMESQLAELRRQDVFRRDMNAVELLHWEKKGTTSTSTAQAKSSTPTTTSKTSSASRTTIGSAADGADSSSSTTATEEEAKLVLQPGADFVIYVNGRPVSGRQFLENQHQYISGGTTRGGNDLRNDRQEMMAKALVIV